MDKLRVLAVGAHPDDVEILCGGTLAKYARLGHEVFIAVATDGSAGHTEIPPDQLAQMRREEAEKAAAIIGAQIYFIGEPDEWLFHDRPTREKFIRAIRWANPDLIITHYPGDYHPDHRACADIVFAASFLSTLPKIMPEVAAQEKVAALFYMDTLAGADFEPEFFVDVTEDFDTKRRMLACHETQVAWLRDHDSIDIFDFIDRVARMRGLQCGCQYAEGFRAAWVWPRISPQRLLP